jgi:protease I
MNRRHLLSYLASAAMGMSLLPTAARGGRRRKSRKSKKSKNGKSPKVLMPIGDATEVVDTFYPFFRLAEEGFDVVVAGPEARLYHLVTHEVPPNSDVPWDITQEGAGYHLEANLAFRDINPEDYAGLFVSGGRAPEYLRYDQDLMRAVRHFFAPGKEKPVAVVCHGVEIVAAAGVLKGRKMTTVGKCALDITQVGGTYLDQPLVVDGNLISCRTWHDYDTQFMKEFIRQLRKRARR